MSFYNLKIESEVLLLIIAYSSSLCYYYYVLINNYKKLFINEKFSVESNSTFFIFV